MKDLVQDKIAQMEAHAKSILRIVAELKTGEKQNSRRGLSYDHLADLDATRLKKIKS